MKIFTALAINNSVAIISFALLSLFFEKWWIVLFALFFMLSITKGENKNDK